MLTLTPEKQRLAVIGALLLWCSALQGCCFLLANDSVSLGLFWNLLLAFLPLPWAAAFKRAMAVGHKIPAIGFFVLWLLFLPNAPYILTDLIHLGPRPNTPLWLYLAMLLSCAGTGTLLGYLSLSEVQSVIEQRWGSRAGWIMASWVLMLCGFGIYVGRFLRWNSWDVVTNPLSLLLSLLVQFVDPEPHPHPVPVTLVFGGGLILGYLAWHALTGTQGQAAEPQHRTPVLN